MKTFLVVLLVINLVSLNLAVLSIEKIEFNILDKSKGSCTVKINPGPPKSVDGAMRFRMRKKVLKDILDLQSKSNHSLRQKTSQ
jgi:hypothetical protein